MKMYKTSNCGNPIEEIDVTRFNDKSYWVEKTKYNGVKVEDRNLRFTSYSNVYETFNEAKEYMIKKTQNDIKNTKKKLGRLLTILKDIENYEI